MSYVCRVKPNYFVLQSHPINIDALGVFWDFEDDFNLKSVKSRFDLLRPFFSDSFICSLFGVSSYDDLDERSIGIRGYCRGLRWFRECLLYCDSQGYLGSVRSSFLQSLNTTTDCKSFFSQFLYWRCGVDSFGLCSTYRKYSAPNRAMLLDNPRYVCVEKLNGLRCFVGIGSGGGLGVYVRDGVRSNILLSDVGSRVCLTDTLLPKVETLNVYDCEILCNDLTRVRSLDTRHHTELDFLTWLLMSGDTSEVLDFQQRYYQIFGESCITFAILCTLVSGGVDLSSYSLEALLEMREPVRHYFIALGIPNVTTPFVSGCTRHEKLSFSDALSMQGGEGVVFWNLDGTYDFRGCRGVGFWIKHKGSLSASDLGLSDTLDLWISGGLVNSKGKVTKLELSGYLSFPDGRSRAVVLAVVKCPALNFFEGLSLDSYTFRDLDGKPTLHPSLRGIVVEVSGDSFSRRHLRVQSPQILRMRRDRSKFDCSHSYGVLSANSR